MQQFVVGDIHGCLKELVALIEGLPLEPEDTLVFLGDYIDRGPDSRGVIDYVLDLKDRNVCEVVCLKGNHEDMLAAFVGLGGSHGDMFLFNGGVATAASYGVRPSLGIGSGGAELLAALPVRHREFFANLDIYRCLGEFLCVHAGVNPHRSWEEQIDEEMIWIRDEFILHEHAFPHTVLFGHTPMEQVFFHLPYKVGLDTGLVYGNLLSCLEITAKTLFQVRKGTTQVTTTPVGHHWQT